MRIKAHAKVNLFLQVKGRFANGYHDLEMVNVPIDLFDSIQIVESSQNTFACDKYYIPKNKKNTMFQVIEKMHAIKPLPPLGIKLTKNIPSQAGLGGGSSDAAALIRFLNKEYQYQLSETRLQKLASEVGADVPFCLMNQLAKVTGVGEHVEPIPRNLDFFLFVVKPNFGISTRELFAGTTLQSDSSKQCDKMIEALRTNNYSMFLENMTNDLQPIAIKKHPAIQHLINELIDFGFDHAMMSGSGSVVYGVTQDEELVDKAVLAFYKKLPFVKKSRMLE